MRRQIADSRQQSAVGGRQSVAARCCLLLTAYCLLLSACSDFASPTLLPLPVPPPAATSTATPSPTPVPARYVVIGKARSGYWDAVERGTQAAEKQLGLPRGSVAFYAPDKEDAAAQIIAVENFAAQSVRGIAIAPSDPRALELSIQQARAAGIWVTTFDSDAPNSQRLFFVGTPQRTIGREGATTLLRWLGGKNGKVAPGSTLLDSAANERIAAFKDTLKANNQLSIVDAANDRHDVSIATQSARTIISSNKDLVGAFGVYGYNSVVWCRALKEAGMVDKIALVGFDVTSETVACLKDGAISALIAPRPFAQGMQSVLALDSLERNGLLATIADLHFDARNARSTWQYDVGVDIVSLNGRVGISLAEYTAKLDEQNIPRDWQP